MARKTEARRAALRETLIDIADRRIGAAGLSALRARDLATEAGCALGAIYTVFGDIGELVMAVNARTFDRLGRHIAAELATAPQDATDQLVIMAQAYHSFAASHTHHWRALFDIDRPEGEAAPEWYLAEMEQLFTYIATPLTTVFPGKTPEDLGLMTRALFSAVHGIVDLGLDAASGGVPASQIDAQLALLLRHITGDSPTF